MRHILIAMMTMLAALPVPARPADDLQSLYEQLDEAIAHVDDYVADYLQQLDSVKDHLRRTTDAQERFRLEMMLSESYRKTMNDSAIHYAVRAINTARQMHRDDLFADGAVRLGIQYSECGAYVEGLACFANIDTTQLAHDRLIAYYSGLFELYGDMAAYSSDSQLQEEQYRQQDRYRDLILATADTTTIAWTSKRMSLAMREKRYSEAKHASDNWYNLTRPDTPEFALMAYYRSCVYELMGDGYMQKVWLARSALSDIRSSVMNQASLWTLAKLLSAEGDMDRAYRYVECSWHCASIYNAHIRNWQISPVLTMINDKYKKQLEQKNTMLMWLLTALTLMLVVLLVLYAYARRKRHQLTVARNELKIANQSLSQLNRQLKDTILHLADANRVKEEYIGKFFSVCSRYIDKLDAYRIKVNRKLKANQHGELLKMTGSEMLREEEHKELLAIFDKVFLQLFPTFVDDFNRLLKPDGQIRLDAKDTLTTDLRIFALIRLGIDESSKIAEFLDYSPNSIYAYRARVKNKAARGRDDFESQVREIGLLPSS